MPEEKKEEKQGLLSSIGKYLEERQYKRQYDKIIETERSSELVPLMRQKQTLKKKIEEEKQKEYKKAFWIVSACLVTLLLMPVIAPTLEARVLE